MCFWSWDSQCEMFCNIAYELYLGEELYTLYSCWLKWSIKDYDSSKSFKLSLLLVFVFWFICFCLLLLFVYCYSIYSELLSWCYFDLRLKHNKWYQEHRLQEMFKIPQQNLSRTLIEVSRNQDHNGDNQIWGGQV